MFQLSVAWWELIIRSVVIYVFLIAILRLTGKRQIGQLAPFDLVLLLALSNSVQNAINGGDNSLIGGVISAVTLILLNYAVGRLTYKSKFMEAVMKVVNKQGVTHAELAARSGLPRSAVTGILSGSLQKVTLDRILKLVEAAGLTAEVKVKRVA
jgi:predicted XRE-type DNA-binding protein